MKLFSVYRLESRNVNTVPLKSYAWAETPAAAVALVLPGQAFNPMHGAILGKWHHDKANDVYVEETKFSDADPFYGGNSERIINPEARPK